MLNRCIYTLYLLARYRKLGDHYLIAGGIPFLWLHLVVLAGIKLLCMAIGVPFVDFFFDHRIGFMVCLILSFFLSKMYAKHVVVVEKKEMKIRRISLSFIWYSMICIMAFFLVIMTCL
ncbi:hypothetical protein [Filimonas effusa]|uniref:Uncharacterized protein n=1 Tax=Filimonas effusa TaxID=2508721 RepID=A0A4Q1D2W0_9BACT|nr:hypothetical protein [Filimonas effusa]RXK81421.1 hypothetical protein ESB13_21040 [Filimonas effusa]